MAWYQSIHNNHYLVINVLNMQNSYAALPRGIDQIFDVYSFHNHRRCWSIFIQYLPTYVPRTDDVGLPTNFLFNVGPAPQPIAGSMPVNRLRRWPNANPLLGLLYTYRKHVAFAQCCFNDDPQSSTLARD